MSVNNLLMVIT